MSGFQGAKAIHSNGPPIKWNSGSAYWGYGIGKNLLKRSIDWADSNHIRKMTLKVLETNKKAILLYERCGFETEGILKEDKLLRDGKYYNTVLMGRIGS